MAATLPLESEGNNHHHQGTSKTNRRQWSVQAGGPKGLLRRMRSQLAEDGCPESQLVMGRTLLDQLGKESGYSEGEGDGGTWEEDARLAVFWLTRASNQGSAEATLLLQSCLNTNTGICEHNYHEVQECLAMELQEKLARRAGRLLFASISDGNEMVTSGSLIKKVEAVLEGDVPACQDTKEQAAATATPATQNTDLETLYGGERFTEEHIVSAAILYHQGCIPPLHQLLSLPLRLTHTHTPPNTLHRMMRRPLHLLRDLYGACLQLLAVSLVRQGRKCAMASSPFILALLFVLLYVFGVRASAFRQVLPAVVLCVALVAMVTSSAAVLLNGRRLECVRTWSRVFSSFCAELDVAAAERKFQGRCWRPYVILCASVLVCVSVMPLVPHALVVAFLPVMCAFSGLLFFLAVNRVALWHFVSLALYLLALSPEVAGALQGVGVGEWLVVGETVSVWGGVHLHLGVGTVLHLLWLGLQVSVGMARGPSHLPPHLASLVWTHLALVASGKVTGTQELVYPTAVWLVLVLVPAAASLSVLVIPAVVCLALTKFSATEEMLVVAFVASACVTFLCDRVWPRLASGVFKVMLVCGAVLVLLKPSAVFTPPSAPAQHSTLQWDAYKNVCAPPNTLEAENVHGCAPLLGTAVRWRGSVMQVTVAQVKNMPLRMVSYLPRFLEAAVKCYLGQRLPQCPAKPAGDGKGQDRCQVVRAALGHTACSLHEWNEYEFEVKLDMQESYWEFGGGESEVSLHAGHTFTAFMVGLREGDVVEFTGTMTAGVGTNHLSLTLSAIKCVTCKLKPSPAQSSPSHASPLPLSHTLYEAARHVFNFFLAPTLTW